MAEEYYSPQELKEIQQLEKKALEVLLDVCAQANICCFLIGGSALGVVRHGGFIPWDDDVDVGMLREDYQRFLEAAPRLLPKGYSLQTPYNSPYNPYPYTKLRVDGTRFVEYCNHSNRRMHHGVYVDIFPYDEVPDDEAENLRHFEQCQKLILRFVHRQSRDVSRPPHTAGERLIALLRIGVYLGSRLCFPREKLLKKLDRTVTAYNGTGQQGLACLNFPKRKCEYALRKDLFPLAEAQFEGIPVKIPGNYDAYLTTHYGDYRKLPPEQDRLGHRPYEVRL